MADTGTLTIIVPKRSASYQHRDKKKKIKKEVKKNIRVEPNIGAGIFLLTNLEPDRWKNKQNTEHSGEISTGLNIIVSNDEDANLIEQLKNKE